MKKIIAALFVCLLIASNVLAFSPAIEAVLGSRASSVVAYTKYITKNTTTFNGIAYDSGNTWTGVIDSELTEALPTTNSSSSYYYYSSTYEVGSWKRGVVAFTGISNIPATATITKVTIGFYLDDISVANYMLLNRLLVNWVNDQVTWNVYSTGNNWNSVGASGSGTDFSATVSAQPAYAYDTWVVFTSDTFSQLKTDVQNWVNGTWSNYGWRIYQTVETGGCYEKIRSSEYTDGSRPYMKVEYTN